MKEHLLVLVGNSVTYKDSLTLDDEERRAAPLERHFIDYIR